MTPVRLSQATFAFIAFSLLALAATAQQPREARIIKLKGDVIVTPAGGSAAPAGPGDLLREGDRLTTGRNSLVQWRMPDDGTLALGEHGALRLKQLAAGTGESHRFVLEKGSVRGVAGRAAALLESSQGRAEIGAGGHGGSFDCHLGSALYCGAYGLPISVSNAHGSLMLGQGDGRDFALLIPNTPPKSLLYRPDVLSDLSRYPPEPYIGQSSSEGAAPDRAALDGGSRGNGRPFPSPQPIRVEPEKRQGSSD